MIPSLREANDAKRPSDAEHLARSFDGVEARPLDGTDGARYPFWSPDSRHIGFFAGGSLKRVALTGGLRLIRRAVVPWQVDASVAR